jgi:hypothetical protein
MLTVSHIDAAMEELDALAPLLSAELGVEPTAASLSRQAQVYKEALMTTRVLAEKLRVVRMLCSSQYPAASRCSNCDDV